MVSYVLVSDPHLHNSYPFGTLDAEGVNSRLRDILKNVSQSIKFAIEKKVSAYILLGDVYSGDSRLLRRLFMQTLLPLIEAQIPIIVLTGNHDGDGKNFIMDDIKLFSQAVGGGKLTILNELRVINNDVQKISFLFLPWQLRQDVVKSVKTYSQRANSEYKHLLFGHWGIKEAALGPTDISIDSSVSKKDLTFFEHVFLGHVHKAQEIGNVTVVGSPAKIDMGERTEKKRFIYLTIDEGRISEVSIPFEDRPFDKIYSDEENFSDRINQVRQGDIVELVFRGTKDKIKSYDFNRLREIILEKGASRVVSSEEEIRESGKLLVQTESFTDEQFVKTYVDLFAKNDVDKKEFFEKGIELLNTQTEQRM